VALSQPFWLGRSEVTQAQWEAVMGSSPYDQEDRSNPLYNVAGMAERIRQPEHPVTASWFDAKEFVRRLNALESA
jgi:formylglycine-generating enzyme required for sulfatase activity